MSDVLTFCVDLRQGGFRLQVQASLQLTDCTAILGASGAGKTTLLRALGGFMPRTSGIEIQCAGSTWQDSARHLPPQERPTACVFQDLRLFPHLSVAGNLDYPLRRRPTAGLQREEVADMLQLDGLLQRMPATLSRGQQQRVAIGRALLGSARVLLLDEPLASLDAAARRTILDDLQRVRQRTGVTLLLVSHSMSDVAHLADHALLLDHGRLIAQGSLTELSADPALTAQLPQRASILQARAGPREPDGVQHLQVAEARLLTLDARWHSGDAVRLRIPAEDVALALTPPADTTVLNVVPGRIVQLVSEAARVIAYVDIGGATLMAAVSQRSVERLQLQPGREVWAMIKSAALSRAND